MFKSKRLLLAIAVAIGVAAVGGAQIEQIIKVFGIGAAVDHFGPDINRAVNKLQNFSDTDQMMTKVVPIISVGDGGYIGAVQVMGPRGLVERVKAVAQVEGNFSRRTFRLKALIPIESKNVVQNIKRVVGVGISALIDIRI